MPATNSGIVSIKLTRDSLVTRIPVNVDSQVSVETKPLDLGDARRDKYIDAVVLELENADEMVQAKVFFKEFDRLKDAESTDYDSGHEVTDVDEPIFVRLQSRYVQLKLVDEFPRARWKLTAIEFYGQPLRGRL